MKFMGSTSAEARADFVASENYETHMAKVLGSLRITEGKTIGEIAKENGMQNVQVQRRLTDLEREKKARVVGERKCNVSKRRCQLWFLIPQQQRLF